MLIAAFIFGVIIIRRIVFPSTEGDPTSNADQAVTALKGTRTAIAVTRDPSLLLPVTPAPVDLTTTALPMTLRAMGGTPRPTPKPGGCQLRLIIDLRDDIREQLKADLQAAEIVMFNVNIYGTGVQNEDCSMDYSYTLFDLAVEMSTVEDQTAMDTTYEAIADVLAVLAKYPEDTSLGAHPARLIIGFTSNAVVREGIIDTGYTNALWAYDEGLRGAALVEALGGFVNFR